MTIIPVLRLVFFLFLLVCSSIHCTVHATTIIVTHPSDTPTNGICDALGVNDGCSLREAITAANQTPSDDVILFAPYITHSIDLNSALPDLRTNINLQGPGAEVLSVRRHLSGPKHRIFSISAGATVQISGLTISEGHVVGNTGADFGGDAEGGGIRNAGTLLINACIIRNNQAVGGNAVGGHFGSGDGGVGRGGGIFNALGATLIINRSTLSHNSAGGGQGFNGGSAEGGGIYTGARTPEGSVGKLVIQHSALTFNTAVAGFSSNQSRQSLGGGVALSGGTATLVNSTLSNNGASGSTEFNAGGAIVNGGGDATLKSCTVADNYAPGGSLYQLAFGVLTVGDTIFEVGAQGVNVNNAGGRLLSQGFNLSSDNSGPTHFTDKRNTSPLLLPLAFNGGPTPTHALAANSPAIDAGASTLTVDQRGLPRPMDGNGDGRPLADIGAFEVQDFAQSGPQFEVNTISDHDDQTCGVNDCTLREAIKAANAAPSDDAITFKPSLNAQHLPITLNGDYLPEIEDNGALSITAPSGGITISGNRRSRIFLISRADVTLTGLTIINGNAQDGLGGAIFNFGTLLLDRCTLTDNKAGGGGAITSLPLFGGSKTLTLRNCTLSGNTATVRGGAVDNISGLIIIESCTITNNSAPAGRGGGITSSGDESTRTEVSNSIIAGNANGDVDFEVDPIEENSNTFVSQGYNLIGKGNAVGAFAQSGDRTAVIDPQLAPLADNGGPTPTHALKHRSPAINAGNSTLPTDQRGITRPQGRTSDIGAYEAVLVTISDQSILEGDSSTRQGVFTVKLSAVLPHPISISYQSVNNASAKAGLDFDHLALSDSDGATLGTLTIPAGQTTGRISVPVFGDVLDESNEVFYILLSAPAGESSPLAFERGRAKGTILDDDRAPAITIQDVTIAEGQSGSRSAIFTLNLSAPSGQIVSVEYATANGTAKEGSDYTVITSQTVHFGVGQTSLVVRVPVRGDRQIEADEIFYVLLRNASNASIGRGRGVGTIQNDDSSS